MAWIYLDDKFPESKKAVAAGGDASWLFVCILGYCRRHATGGKVMKRLVPQLSDRKSPQRLAVRLCEVDLLEDDGDFWQVHNYDFWNQTEKEKRQKERAQKAARSRWENDASSIAKASDKHSVEQCTSNAQPMPARANPHPHPQSPSPLVTSSVPFTVVVGTAGESQDLDTLEARLIATCVGSNRVTVAREATEVISHLRRFVDDRVIDEAIGTYALASVKPSLPRAVAAVAAKRAKERGVPVPDFEPSKSRRTAAGIRVIEEDAG